MDLIGVVAAKQGGTEILGMFHGKHFVWPDPWTDIWDEGTSVLFENVWRDYWSDPYSTPIAKELSGGN